MRTVARREGKNTALLCVEAHGFSLHAAVRVPSFQRKELERLCRYITRPALANERLSRNGKGQVVLQLKSPYRDGTTHIVMQSPFDSMRAFDISDPLSPVQIGSVDMPWALFLAVRGNYAYVSSYDFDVKIIDVSDPTAPVEVGGFDLPGFDLAVD